MSQIDSEIDLYFNLGNLGLGKEPTSKLDVEGSIKSNEIILSNTNIKNENNNLKILNNDTSSIILSKNKSIIFTDKLGINNNDPQHTLDVAGDIKFKNNIYGNSGMLISEDSNINFNKNNDYENTNFYGNINLSNNSNLSISNKISDNNNNEFIDFSDDKTFKINSKYNVAGKDTTFYGQVNFFDMNKGVNIGGKETDNVNGGELHVENKIKTNNLEFNDIPERMINFKGNNASNIKLGNYSYISNLSTNSESNQSALFGHNLYADNDNVRIADTTDNYGYRGIVMNDINGIQFYASNKSTKKDDIPNLPNMTISNSGQLIYRIPVLEVEFDIDDLENEVYQYIKDEMQNKIIGSTMTFTTYKYLNKDMIFNVIKNGGTTSKCYIIDKKTNNVHKYFDIIL